MRRPRLGGLERGDRGLRLTYPAVFTAKPLNRERASSPAEGARDAPSGEQERVASRRDHQARGLHRRWRLRRGLEPSRSGASRPQRVPAPGSAAGPVGWAGMRVTHVDAKDLLASDRAADGLGCTHARRSHDGATAARTPPLHRGVDPVGDQALRRADTALTLAPPASALPSPGEAPNPHRKPYIRCPRHDSNVRPSD